MKKEHELAYVGTFLGEQGIAVPEELIQKRRKICAYCPHRVPLKTKEANYYVADVVEGEELPKTAGIEWTEQEIEICDLCGCEIGAKVEQVTGWCPIYKWELSYEEWEKYILTEIERRVSIEGSYEPMEWERESQREKALRKEKEKQELDAKDSDVVE